MTPRTDDVVAAAPSASAGRPVVPAREGPTDHHEEADASDEHAREYPRRLDYQWDDHDGESDYETGKRCAAGVAVK